MKPDPIEKLLAAVASHSKQPLSSELTEIVASTLRILIDMSPEDRKELNKAIAKGGKELGLVP